jgi:hypothetical protein
MAGMVGQAQARSQRRDSRSVPDWVSPILDVDAGAESSDSHAMLLAELAVFVTRHRACGQLTGDATANGYLLMVGCSCGVAFLRWVTLEEAAMELEMSDLATSMS